MSNPSLASNAVLDGYSFVSESPSDELRAAMAESLLWVDSLDRSALGDMAASRELLASVHAVRREQFLQHLGLSNDILINELWAEEHANSNAGNAEDIFVSSYYPRIQQEPSLTVQVDAEVMMWIGSSSLPYRYNFDREAVKIDLLDTLGYLKHAVANPDGISAAMPYYDAGVRGADFIERCISDGIDVEVALILTAREREQKYQKSNAEDAARREKLDKDRARISALSAGVVVSIDFDDLVNPFDFDSDAA